MRRHTPREMSLPQIPTVNEPCPVAWGSMTGTEQTRHCSQCECDVHNLSAMTSAEADEVMNRAGDQRLCVNFVHDRSRRRITLDSHRDQPVQRARVRMNSLIEKASRFAAMVGLAWMATMLNACGSVVRTGGKVCAPTESPAPGADSSPSDQNPTLR